MKVSQFELFEVEEGVAILLGCSNKKSSHILGRSNLTFRTEMQHGSIQVSCVQQECTVCTTETQMNKMWKNLGRYL